MRRLAAMLHRCWVLAVQHVHRDALGNSVGGITRVFSGVGGSCLLDEEVASGGLTLFGDHANSSPRRVVADDRIVMIPEDVGRWLRAESHNAGEIDGAPSVYIQIRAAYYFCGGLNNVEMDVVAHVRRSADLALVDSRVSVLWILDHERPVLRVRLVDGTKALVTCVRVAANGQQVDVAMSDPRHRLAHRSVAEVLDTAVEIRRLSQKGSDVLGSHPVEKGACSGRRRGTNLQSIRLLWSSRFLQVRRR